MIRRWFFDVIKGSLPNDIQVEYAKQLERYQNDSFIEQLRQTFPTLAYAYQVLAFDAINLRVSIAEVALLTFVLIAAGVGPATFFIDGLVLGALFLRDIWAHRRLSKGAKMPPLSQYYLDSMIDAVAAEVALLFTQCLAPRFSSFAMHGGVLGPIAAILLPLIAVVRMVLRPQPDPETPGSWSGLTADEIYRHTWRLNAIWGALYSITILMNTSDIPHYYPDVIRGFAAGGILPLWIAFQRDALGLRDKIIRLFGNKKAELERKKARLPRGLKPGEPGYWMMWMMSVLVVAAVVYSEGEVLWRWLSGLGQHVGWFVLTVSMLSFVTTVASWRYVKYSNLAAAEAMQNEIDALDRETERLATDYTDFADGELL